MRLSRHAAFAVLAGAAICAAARLEAQTTAADSRRMLDQYCVNCHNQKLRTAGLELGSPRRVQARGQCGGLGKSDRQAARRLDAAAGTAAAGCGDLSRGGGFARKRNRSRLGGQSEPGDAQRSTV